MSQRASKFPSKLVKSSLGEEVCAIGETVDPSVLIRDFCELFEGLAPWMAGLADCGGSSTHLQTRKMVAEEFRVRRFLSIQQALEQGDLGNIHRPPGAGILRAD